MIEAEVNQTDRADLLSRAHHERENHRFEASCQAFERAAEDGELAADDLLAWGDSAWWLGDADRALKLAESGHERLLADGRRVRAAKEAISLGFLLMLRGDLAAGSGWLQRGRSLLEGADEASRGYVLELDAEMALRRRDTASAIALSRRARDAARLGSDASLLAMASMTEGKARLMAGDVAEGLARLDEAMLPVRAGKVAPDTAGNLYCQMIEVCWELVDLRRAREWTIHTEHWCESFDSSVMFSGICRMHRVQLRQVAGEWDTASTEAQTVCTELVGMNTSVVAEGHYLLGDLFRLRGEPDKAEAAYVRAHELGRQPQPGLSLLRADAGEVEAALVSLQLSLDNWPGPEYGRGRLLDAIVEVAVAAQAHEAARGAASELGEIARRWQSEGLRALAAYAFGIVELAFGDATRSVERLGEATSLWHALEARYDCARARAALAEAYARIGDETAARLERSAASSTLDDLGAATRSRIRPPAGDLPGGLTRREAEVLLAVAQGGTNRQVATALFISERTVARHLANIYPKLGVSTRTAAVAWARRSELRVPA